MAFQIRKKRKGGQKPKPITHRPFPQISCGLHSRGGSVRRIAALSMPAGRQTRRSEPSPVTTEAGGGDVCKESGGTVVVLGVGVLRRGTTGPFQGGIRWTENWAGTFPSEAVGFICCDAIWP